MKAAIEIAYIVHIWREGRQFVAHAMPLDVMSAGRTPAEARSALDEAVEVFLETAADMSTIEDILLETGYENINGKWVSPDWVATERSSTAIGA